MKRRFNFEPNTEGYNAIEIHCFYQKPGYNYYNGDKETGGFYLSFQPGEVKTDPEGRYSSFCFTMFTSGFKIKVMDGTRDNKKKWLRKLSRETRAGCFSLLNK